MRAILDAKALRNAALVALRSVDQKTGIDVLAHLMMIANNGAVSLTGTDLNIAITATIEAMVEIPGTAILPAGRFVGLLIGLSGSIRIEANGGTAILRCGRSAYRLATLPLDYFPTWVELDADRTASWKVGGKDLHGLLAVAVAVSSEDPSPNHHGVALQNDSGFLCATATDGKRLIHAGTGIPYGNQQLHFESETRRGVIIPMSTATLVAKLFKRDATIATDGRRITVSADGLILTSKLIDDVFPNWSRVVPEPSATMMAKVESAADVLGALRRCIAVAGKQEKTSPTITLAWDSDVSAEIINLTLKRPECDAHEVVGATNVAGSVSIRVNAEYLADVIETFDADAVVLSLQNGKSAPAPIRVDTPDMFGLVAQCKF
jgi:DNA polymerase-3 subunit beta